jgi:hypothetical protein
MMFFETTGDGIYPTGTVVEMVGIGPAELDDDEEHERRPYIWATDGSVDTPGHWYFRSEDLRPVTRKAADALAELRRMERTHGRRRYFRHVANATEPLPSRPLPF